MEVQEKIFQTQLFIMGEKMWNNCNLHVVDVARLEKLSHLMGSFLEMAPEKKAYQSEARFTALIWPLHTLQNKHAIPSEKWNGKGRPTASRAPVSQNVKLIYPPIKWKTIEMSARVIHQLCKHNDRTGNFSPRQQSHERLFFSFCTALCKADLTNQRVVILVIQMLLPHSL